MRRGWVGIVLALVLAAPAHAAAPTCLTPVAADGSEPPCNPFGGSTVWTTSHRGPYAQGSSPYPGPLPGEPVTLQRQALDRETPTILQVSDPYPDGRRVRPLVHLRRRGVRGRATDRARGRPAPVRRVEVCARRAGQRCRFVRVHVVNGRFSRRLPAGRYRVTVRATDRAGNVALRTAVRRARPPAARR